MYIPKPQKVRLIFVHKIKENRKFHFAPNNPIFFFSTEILNNLSATMGFEGIPLDFIQSNPLKPISNKNSLIFYS